MATMQPAEWVDQVVQVIVMFSGNHITTHGKTLTDAELNASIRDNFNTFLQLVFDRNEPSGRFRVLDIPPQVRKDDVAKKLSAYKTPWRTFGDIKRAVWNELIPKLKQRGKPNSGEQWEDVMEEIRVDLEKENQFRAWSESTSKKKPAVFVEKPTNMNWFPKGWLVFIHYGPHTSKPLDILAECLESSSKPMSAEAFSESIESQRMQQAMFGSKSLRRTLGLTSNTFLDLSSSNSLMHDQALSASRESPSDRSISPITLPSSVSSRDNFPIASAISRRQEQDSLEEEFGDQMLESIPDKASINKKRVYQEYSASIRNTFAERGKQLKMALDKSIEHTQRIQTTVELLSKRQAYTQLIQIHTLKGNITEANRLADELQELLSNSL